MNMKNPEHTHTEKEIMKEKSETLIAIFTKAEPTPHPEVVSKK